MKDFSRTGARLFRITAAVLLILFLLLWGAQTLFAHRNPVFTPDYPMEDLTALLAQEQISAADYDTLFLQTGLGTPAIDALLAQGAQGREQVLAIQRQFFAAPATVCAELFGLLVREDRLAPDENGQPVWGPPMPALEDGDVLLTVESIIKCRRNRYGFSCIIFLSEGRRKEVKTLNGYSYLTLEQRREIERMYAEGERVVDIAARLKRSAAAIYEELKRGYTGEFDSYARPKYSADLAQATVQENFRRRGNRRGADR